jgi:multiple sugar transport system ATP-binding protein
MARITIDRIDKVFAGGVKAVDEFSLDIEDGEFMVLVGPSGCGKSTALRMVAGLEEISAGTVTIGDKVVNDVPPKDRDIAMVFQNYAPHMTVEQHRESETWAERIGNSRAASTVQARFQRPCAEG